MKYFPFVFLLFFVLAACSEQKTEKKSDTLKLDSIHGNHVRDSINNKGLPKERVVYYYDGTIGKNLSIEVTLYTHDNDSLSGKYRYVSQVTFLVLKGVINGKQYELTEYDSKDRITGYFKGEYNKEKGTVTGIWTNTNGTSAFPFTLTTKTHTNNYGDVVIGSKLVTIKDSTNCVCAEIYLPIALEKLYPEKLNMVNSFLSFENIVGEKENEVCTCTEDQRTWGLAYGSYNVSYNKNMILSLEWWGQYSGAYPMAPVRRYINLNLNTGQPIALKDMFNHKGSQYVVQYIENEINKLLAETFESVKGTDAEEFIKESCEPIKINPARLRYTFTEERILFHYELSFPAYGQCYNPGGNVDLSYDKLTEDMLSENSVLEPMVK